MKKLLCLCTAAALTVTSLAGCGTKEKTADNSGEKQTIRITYSAGELDGQSNDLNEIFADFYADHPNCEVVLEENGSALMAKIAANDAPDIIRTSSNSDLPTYVNKKIIIPLDDLLKKSKLYDKNDIFDICINDFRYDGKEYGKGPIYGLPKDWSTSMLWVNKKMFEQAGLPIPTMENPLKYEQLTEYAKKLTVKNGDKVEVFGISDSESVEAQATRILALMGKSMWSKDFTKTNLKDPEVRAVFKSIYERKRDGYNQSSKYSIGGNGNPQFAMGKAAMNLSGLYAGMVYEKNAERTVAFEDMILCPPIVTENNKGVVVTAGATGGAISVNAKDKIDLVFDCWEYIHLGKLMEKRAAKGFNLPVKKSVADSVKLETEFMSESYKKAVELANCEAAPLVVNPYVAASAVSGVMEKFFTPVIYGQSDFDEAMDVIDNELQLLIDEGRAN